MTGPSVGRVVHYVSAGSADGKFPSVCRAAIVTEVGRPGTESEAVQAVSLLVLNPTGIHFRPLAEGGARYADTVDGDALVPYTWHWPERV